MALYKDCGGDYSEIIREGEYGCHFYVVHFDCLYCLFVVLIQKLQK
jgi:hypothetical protein